MFLGYFEHIFGFSGLFRGNMNNFDKNLIRWGCIFLALLLFAMSIVFAWEDWVISGMFMSGGILIVWMVLLSL